MGGSGGQLSHHSCESTAGAKIASVVMAMSTTTMCCLDICLPSFLGQCLAECLAIIESDDVVERHAGGSRIVAEFDLVE